MFQELKVVLKKQSQIVNAVAQHRETLHAHAERKAAIGLAVDINRLEYFGMYHAAAHYFQPAGVAAYATALAAAHHAFDIDFCRRFGKREIGRSKAHLDVFFKEGAQKFVNHAFQVGKADVGIDQKAFDLMEHRGVGNV